MDLRIAIVDDDPLDRAALAAGVRAALGAPGGHRLVAEYPSAEELLAAFTPGSLDLAFLDVRMGGMNGIELAAHLRAADPALLIVFVTTMADYALDAYPTHPFDFLVKPWDTSRLTAVLRDAARALGSEEKSVQVTVPYGTVELAPSAIASIEASNHAVVFRSAGGSEVRSTLLFSDAAALVEGDARFLQINRGVIVNMDHVVSVEGSTVIMAGGAHLPLRKRDRATLARAIAQHLIARMGGARG